MVDRIAEPAQPLHSVQLPSRLLLMRLTVAVAVVILWQVGAGAYPALIATPVETLIRLLDLIATGAVIPMVGLTTIESASGLAIGAGAGVFLPFLVQMSPRLQAVVEPYARAAVGIPKLALSPILIMVFEIGLTAKIVLVSLMTFFLVFVATFAGLRSVGPTLVRTVSVFGAGQVEIAREVLWHAVQPYVWAALRAALPWAINAALVSEFLASQNGLGYYIHHSYNNADITGVYAGIVLVVALVLLADAVVLAAQRRFMSWRPVDQDMVLH